MAETDIAARALHLAGNLRAEPNGHVPDTDEADPEDEERVPRLSQASQLVALARQGDTELFHDPTGKAHLTFSNGAHRETWPLNRAVLLDWLAARFYAAHQTVPNGQSLNDTSHALTGIARFEGQCRPVYVRRAGHDANIYIDLGNEAWEVIRISPDGWDIIAAADAPVRFRRPNGLLPLPHPTRGGTLSDLRTVINVKSESAFTLIAAWLLGALRPEGPYPILALAGEQGTAKTTLGRMVRALIDPNVSPLRTEPRDEGDLLIAATQGAVVALDNLSHLSPRLSDALCRLATGGGLSKRKLYTDEDETLLDACRPVLLTGIEAVLTRGDAIDRALLVELEKIADSERRTETELDATFDAIRPGVLGVLLDAASCALRNWETTRPARLPRMADFARWVEAGAPAFGWEPGHFLDTYTGNRDEADHLALDALPVGAAVRAFMEGREEWAGTATTLLTILSDQAGETTKDRAWPKKGHNLSGHLKKLAPNLRRLGIEVQTGLRGTDGGRLIRLTNTCQKEGEKQRQERQERQDAHCHADSAQVQQRQPASRIEPTASSATGENPHNSAENGHHADALDAVDADSDALRVAEGDAWASARQVRL